MIGKNSPCWCGSGKKYKHCHEEWDNTINVLKLQGKIVPSHNLIKSEEDIKWIKKAAKINNAVLDLVGEKICAGMTTEDIDKLVYDYTTEHGAIPAPLNFEGFPKSVCTSINNEVCHGIPDENIILKDGDIINIDVAVIKDGFYGDTSRMYYVGQVSPQAQKLVETTYAAMVAGMATGCGGSKSDAGSDSTGSDTKTESLSGTITAAGSSALKPLADDPKARKEFMEIKYQNKIRLAKYIKEHNGIDINPDSIFDVQVKRLHEYKRQLMNILHVMYLYNQLKKNPNMNFYPTTFIFGAKAAPGYARAKAIIKYINEIAKLVNNDPETKDLLQVYFISNYNVSYAEKIVVAADLSEQTSTAGLEASGTGNMKFMLNGAPTLGTLDGANVEIAECAGIENEYIFGAKVEDIERMKKEGYHPKALYDANPEIKRVVDTLIDGTFDDGGAQGEGSFKELHDSLLKDSSWQKADNYFLIYDLPDYVDTKIRANTEYANRKEFGKKCLINIANAGKFSSDRTILQYAKEIWHTSYKK